MAYSKVSINPRISRTHFDLNLLEKSEVRLLISLAPSEPVRADDDRNVPSQQTTDLVEKLRAQNVAFEAIGTLSDERGQARSAPTSRSARDTGVRCG